MLRKKQISHLRIIRAHISSWWTMRIISTGICSNRRSMDCRATIRKRSGTCLSSLAEAEDLNPYLAKMMMNWFRSLSWIWWRSAQKKMITCCWRSFLTGAKALPNGWKDRVQGIGQRSSPSMWDRMSTNLQKISCHIILRKSASHFQMESDMWRWGISAASDLIWHRRKMAVMLILMISWWRPGEKV